MEIKFRIYCSVCGEELTGVLRTSGYDTVTIDVDPCTNCLDDRYDVGYEDGKLEG